jgi:hypothetical protein
MELKTGDKVRVKKGHVGEGTVLEVLHTWIDGDGRACFAARGFSVWGPYWASDVEKI